MSADFSDMLMRGEQVGSRYALTMPRRVPMGLTGSQVGHQAGSSLEFKEHREYMPGDDLRRIDWSAYARSDRLHVKLYREEVSPHLDLLIDGSASMNLTGSRKADATVALAGALSAAASNSGYTHAAHLAGDGCQPILNGNEAPPLWRNITFDHDEPLHDSLQQLPPRFKSQSIRVLISDLLFMGDPALVLQQIATRAAVVVVVQVLARSDVDPPQRGSVRLTDSETGQIQEVFIDATAQQRYRDALARHQDNWHRAAVQVGATMTTVVAESFLKDWDLSALIEKDVLRVA